MFYKDISIVTRIYEVFANDIMDASLYVDLNSQSENIEVCFISDIL